MGNFKVKTDKQTYNQVKSLLLESGFRISAPTGNDWVIGELGGIISSYSNWRDGPPEWFYNIKEITLSELRDMVVLKRNDASDATHESPILKYFKACDDWYYFDLGCTDKWQKSAGAKPEYYEKLKPIEKAMKEYLDKQEDGTYKLITVSSSCADRDWIEVPEGAIRARFYPHDPDGLEFENAFCQWWDNESKAWVYYTDYAGAVQYSRVVWRRTPSLNDQYAEIEQVRQAIKVPDGNDSNHALDAMSFGFMGFGAAQAIGRAKDNVDHPSHYTQGKVECIDALESATIGKSGIEAVCVANVIKYLWRYEEKNGLEDVKKAQWYLERLIASMDS